jgi:hypothetical protein
MEPVVAQKSVWSQNRLAGEDTSDDISSVEENIATGVSRAACMDVGPDPSDA